jgi:acyl carrier protein
MTRDDVLSTVLEEVKKLAPECDTASLVPQTRLREELDLDSFDFLRLVTALQKRLRLDIPEKDYRHLATLGGCASYLFNQANLE